MPKYIIDNEMYNCTKKDALDIARARNQETVYIIGKANHWQINRNSGKFFIATGGNNYNDIYALSSVDFENID